MNGKREVEAGEKSCGSGIWPESHERGPQGRVTNPPFRLMNGKPWCALFCTFFCANDVMCGGRPCLSVWEYRGLSPLADESDCSLKLRGRRRWTDDDTRDPFVLPSLCLTNRHNDDARLYCATFRIEGGVFRSQRDLDRNQAYGWGGWIIQRSVLL